MVIVDIPTWVRDVLSRFDELTTDRPVFAHPGDVVRHVGCAGATQRV